ncbi:MAG TPA: choice-of-anchor Q domain-containing protein [Kofleriaceae bacterium]|jgi:hypothetical protein
MDSEIVFTDPNGSQSSDCSRSAPCTLDHALTLTPPSGGQYVELAAGDYNEGATVEIEGKRILVGRGANATTIRNAGTGQIFLIDDGGDGTLDSVELADAPGSPAGSTNGYAVYCPDAPAGTRSVHILDALITNSAGDAVRAQTCTVEIRRTVIDGNLTTGLAIGTSTTIVDQTLVSSNAYGAGQVSGDFSITNSFFVRNGGGLILGGATSPVFAFNTVADNDGAFGLDCSASAAFPTIVVSSSILARNAGQNLFNTGCVESSTVDEPDVSGLNFASPETAPYDYHLLAGSIAVDAASSCSVDHDFDGDKRPKGAACDIGADEAF